MSKVKTYLTEMVDPKGNITKGPDVKAKSLKLALKFLAQYNEANKSCYRITHEMMKIPIQ